MEPDVDIVIVGAGFAGIAMTVALLAEGRTSLMVLERATELGGTWRENSYPGCACDIPSHLYSYSFDQNPHWSHMFSSQWEIQEYLRSVARRRGVLPFIRFGKTLERGHFDAATGQWQIQTSDGDHVRCRVLISAAGALTEPRLPNVPGIETFQGELFHSARWDHSLALEGKRVATIGTGASAIQFIPEIAPRVAQLHVFQRSAPWVFPKLDRPMRAWERAAFARFPVLQRLLRGWIFCRLELLGLSLVYGRSKLAERAAQSHIAAQVSDPELRARITPDYAVGCKRLLISNDYYPALTRSNVELVTTPIERITKTGIVTRDGRERSIDCLILGTGFDVHHAPLDLVGLDGRRLIEDWASGQEAYMTVAATGYPNLFFLMGPNSGTGHNSVVYLIETQVRHLLALLRSMERDRIGWLHPKPAAQDEFNRMLDQRLERSVWTTGRCQSWYRSPRGRITTLWPGLLLQYRKALRHVDLSGYDTTPQACLESGAAGSTSRTVLESGRPSS